MNWKQFINSLATALVSGALAGAATIPGSGPLTWRTTAVPVGVGALAGLLNFLRQGPAPTPVASTVTTITPTSSVTTTETPAKTVVTKIEKDAV